VTFSFVYHLGWRGVTRRVPRSFYYCPLTTEH
jgi:hypothetical protein